nr:ATP synthase F0 subunit 6 [Asiopsocus sonorensis]
MMDLFSIFDPSSSLNLPLNWIMLMIPLLSTPLIFWASPSMTKFIWLKLMFLLYKEFKLTINLKSNNKNMVICLTIFSFSLFSNSLSMMPYVFTSTTHLSLTLMVSLSLWLSFMTFGWFKNTTHMLSHLIPLGTPLPLMPFMIYIELISNLIRPITLSVRLTANMIAGQLLLSLLSSPSNSLIFVSSIVFMQMLIMLESSVSFIQSYVMTVLISLYSNEVN